MTLALLLTAVTGAWAESKPIGLNVEYAVGDVITSTTDVYVYYGEHPTNHKQMAVKITSTQPLTISMIDAYSIGFNGNDAVYYLPDGDATGGSAGVIPCVGESTGDATVVHVASGTGTLTDPYVFGSGPSGTPVPITWDATAKTATIAAMPAGNVTVKVKYFAQAEFAKSIGETPELLAPTAINDVPATTDGAIVKAGTVANIGTSEVKQGTLMYFVSQSTGETAPEAPDYDTDGWSEDVPTANGLAQGKAYVWYYIKGAEPAQVTDRTDDNTRSDSDIMPLGTDGFVTLAAEPTYAVTFADDLAEPTLWSASPNADVKKGTDVTVTYTGSKKVIGVKAEKKAAPKTLAEATLEDIGKIAGKDGKIYATKADAEAVATGNAVAMIAYVGTASDCAHGLAIALEDVSNEQLTWNNSGNNNESKTAAEWCSAWNTSKAVTGGTWRLPSISDWQYMFIGCGASESYSDNPIQMSYSGLASKLTTAQGDALPVNDDYWSSTVASPSYPWTVLFGDSYAFFGNNTWEGHAFDLVRACLAF